MNENMDTTVQTSREVDCPICDGTGGAPDTCLGCNGSGKVTALYPEPTITYADHQKMVNGLQARIESCGNSLREAVARHADYKVLVRNAVIEVQADEDLCIEGVNRFLENIGLDLIESEFEVQWNETYTVEITRTGTVSASTEDEARDLVADDPSGVDSSDDIEVLLRDQLGYGNYEGTDEVEIISVETA